MGDAKDKMAAFRAARVRELQKDAAIARIPDYDLALDSTTGTIAPDPRDLKFQLDTRPTPQPIQSADATVD